jgi:hypothetical protein
MPAPANTQMFPAIEEWVLAQLRAAMPTAGQVHDGQVLIERSAPGQPVVVRYKLPYITYTSNVGDVSNRRLAKRVGRHSTFWSLMIVGQSREQVTEAGHRARNALLDVRPDIDGYRFWPVTLEESQRIYRDDDAIQPDGKPLFYGVDNYAVAHIIKRTA